MQRLLVIPAALLFLLAGAIVWSGGGRARRADFIFINRGDVGTLDTNRMSWLQDIRLGYALWEGLYALDPATLDPVPGAAERIEISLDKTVYTFHLRPEGRWSNGDAVTSADFVFAWRRMLEQPGDYTYLLHYIRGAEAYEEDAGAGKPADFASVGIEPLDARTLRVTLKHPVTFFPDLCAFPPYFPLNERSMAPFRQVDQKTHAVTYDQMFTRPPNLVSNGPFVLKSWEFKRRLLLEKNRCYWDAANVKSETIECVNADDPQWAFLKYDSGAVDWVADVSGEIAAELRAKGRKDLRVFPGFGTYFYSVNVLPRLSDGRPNPLSDVRVRRALAMALDKKPIVQNVTRMGEPVTDTYIPPGIFPGYTSPHGLPFDVTAARDLLAAAGYPAGRGFPRLPLLFNSEGQHGDIAQVVRREWLENLGVEFDLTPVEIKTFRDRLHRKDYAIARASWIGDYPDVSTFTDKYLSVSENNDSGWASPEYDRLCKEAEIEPDAAKRLALFTRAEQLICDEVPIIPVYDYVNAYLHRDDVQGIALNPRNMVVFKGIKAGR